MYMLCMYIRMELEELPIYRVVLFCIYSLSGYKYRYKFRE